MISLTALAVLLMAMVLLWLCSVVIRDVSIVDVFWGPAFALIVIVCVATTSSTPSPVQWTLAALVAAWSLRLALYLGWRAWGTPEDHRYAAMRARFGSGYWWWSAIQVFALQGVLAWVVALPLQAALLGPAMPWHALHLVGAVAWCIGLYFETVGDLQLARFKADPAQAGAVMDRGLWRYTRHPNYFGDFMVWWGLFGFSVGCGAPLWTVVGPAVMSVLLLRVSGVTLLESSLRRRRPAYAEYIRRTSAFFPWWPKRPANPRAGC